MSDDQQPIAERIRDLIADFLNVQPEDVAPEIPLTNFSVDSIDFIEILFLIEDKTGLALPGDPGELRARIHSFADIYSIAEECEAAEKAANPVAIKGAAAS